MLGSPRQRRWSRRLPLPACPSPTLGCRVHHCFRRSKLKLGRDHCLNRRLIPPRLRNRRASGTRHLVFRPLYQHQSKFLHDHHDRSFSPGPGRNIMDQSGRGSVPVDGKREVGRISAYVFAPRSLPLLQRMEIRQLAAGLCLRIIGRVMKVRRLGWDV